MLYKQHLIAIIPSKSIISSSPVHKLTHKELKGTCPRSHSESVVSRRQRCDSGQTAQPGVMPCMPGPAPPAERLSPERRSAAGLTNEWERGG